MWKQVRRSLLLGAALLAAAAQAQNAAGSGSEVLITMPINVDGSLKDLQLMRGESIEDAAFSFARTNGLLDQDDNRVRQVLEELSGHLKNKVAEIEANTQPSPPQAAAPSVQLAFPITVDSYTGEVRKYEGESVDAAAERFLYQTGFSMDVMRELFPQIVEILNKKLTELQPARKELFSFELAIDGTPVVVRHFDGGNPIDEAIATLRSLNVGDGKVMDEVAPQIANEIRLQMEMRAPQQPAAAAPVAAAAPAPRELFSIPLNIEDRAAVLVHAEGMTTRESALRFLNDNGITDPATISSYLPQIMGFIDTRMSEYLRTEAEATAATAAAQESPAPARRRLLSLAVDLGNNRSADLEYFEGDSVERTVELFLQNVGLADSPDFAGIVAQLADEVRQRVAAVLRDEAEQERLQLEQQLEQQRQRQRELDAQATAGLDPIIVLPVTLSGKTYRLEYYAAQEPSYVANTFCVEKYELVRAELGIEFDGNQLQECKNVILQTLNNELAQRQQAAPPAQPEAAPPAQPTARGDLLFTLDIDDGEGGSFQLPFHRNDDVQVAASDFCKRYGIDLSNVPALVQGIQAQLA